MNEEKIKEIISLYKDDILRNDGENYDKFMLIVLSDIERQTRHKCASMAFDLANGLSNLK